MRPFGISLLSFTLTVMLASAADSYKPTSSAGTLLTANKAAHAMGIIDPVAGKQLMEVPEGGITGHEVIASPDGKVAYVPIYGNSGVGKKGTDGRNIVVIDIASRKVIGKIDFEHAVRPHSPTANVPYGRRRRAASTAQ